MLPSPDSNGWVIPVVLSAPSLQDNTADADRLCRAVRDALKVAWVDIDLDVARRLPDLLRSSGYRVHCLVFQDRERALVIDVRPGDDSRVWAGLAVDLGTTRVVLRLIDLTCCRILAETAFDNPQIAFGPDILARIHHADLPAGAESLQKAIVGGLNDHMDQLCRLCGLTRDDIYLLAVAGNSTMSHLLAGLPAHWLIRDPYIPAVNRLG